jgi:hypothetical protein
MAESQEHGFKFEEIIKKEKLLLINKLVEDEIGYTNEWDVPPVSVKSFKYDSKTIEFGSIERMFKNEINFILVLIGYSQENNIKTVVFSDALLINKQILKSLKKNLTLEDIYFLSNKLKSFSEGYHNEARSWAKEQKKIFNNKTYFDIRFKIDSKKQRRIQCALKIDVLFDIIKTELIKENKLQVPNIESKSRKRG